MTAQALTEFLIKTNSSYATILQLQSVTLVAIAGFALGVGLMIAAARRDNDKLGYLGASFVILGFCVACSALFSSWSTKNTISQMAQLQAATILNILQNPSAKVESARIENGKVVAIIGYSEPAHTRPIEVLGQSVSAVVPTQTNQAEIDDKVIDFLSAAHVRISGIEIRSAIAAAR